MVDPIGVLRVAVLQGNGFPNTDMLGTGAPDVYIEIEHGGVVKVTDHVDDKNNPVFDNRILDFVIATNSENQLVTIAAHDYDIIGLDDKLGTRTLLMDELFPKEKVSISLIDEKFGKNPTVTLMSKRLNISLDPEIVKKAIREHHAAKKRFKQSSRLLLNVNVSECRNLPKCTSPYVKIKYGNSIRFETGSGFKGTMGDVTYSTENPLYVVSFRTFIEDDVSEKSKLKFIVKDRNNNRNIGVCSVLLTDKETTEFTLEKCKGENSTLHASVRLCAVLDDKPFWEA